MDIDMNNEIPTPNSFGVEWDTNALLLIDKSQYGLIPEKGIIQSGHNWTITKESYWPGRKKLERDCVASLEAQLGVFYSDDNPTTFNDKAYYDTCRNFQTAWTRIMRELYIRVGNTSTVFPVLTTIVSDQPVSQGTTDCSGTNPGFNTYYLKPTPIPNPQDLRYQSYTNNLQYISGIPQLTMGFQLKYCVSVWDYTSKLLDHWKTRPDMLDVLKSGMAVQRVFDSLKATTHQVSIMKSMLKDVDTTISLRLFNLILLCNNHLIGLNREGSKYVKASMLYKVRTNLRGVYETFDTNEKLIFDEWALSLRDKTFRTYETPLWEATEWVAHFNSPLVGYVITHIPDNITTNLSMKGIYSIEPGTLDIMQGWNLKFREVNYISSYKLSTQKDRIAYEWAGTEINYIPAPRIMLTNKYNLIYVDSNELLSFDIGEWYYDNQVIMEVRGIPTIHQLIMAWERGWFHKPATHISVMDLCRERIPMVEDGNFYFSDIINNYLNKILYTNIGLTGDSV